MKSIDTVYTNTLIIKKSQFITTLIPCHNLDDVDTYIQQYSKDDATHNCVAYIINNHERAIDNGEPSGTAGLPMLNVLKRQELSHILVIVTRYFGGIKLGAGGLTRAYSNSVSEALKVAHIVNLELVKKYCIDIDYHYQKKVSYLLNVNNILIEDTIYDTQVHYHIYLKDTYFLDQLSDLTRNTHTYRILGEEYISLDNH